MVDFNKSDKMIKISRKVNKPILTTDLIFHSLLEKEQRNIEIVVSVGLSTFSLIFITSKYIFFQKSVSKFYANTFYEKNRINIMEIT